MRNSIKTFVCALALVATVFTANAENKESKKPTGFEAGIYPSKNGKINVRVDKINNAAPTTLLLKDASGNIVYRETISKGDQKFGRVLNLEELASGKYVIEISSNGETQSKAIQLSEQKIERTLTLN